MKEPNPFNPGKPANPSEMVGRNEQIYDFERFLSGAMHESPMSMAVIGVRGIGKTSLLAKFEEVALEKGCIVIRLEAEENRFSRVEDVYKEILRNLDTELKRRSILQRWEGGIKEFIGSFSFQITYSDIGIKIDTKEKEIEYLPIIFREKMINIWKNIKHEVPAVVIMIDEAEYLEQIKGSLMSLRNMFSRLAEKGCGCMVVISGKLTFHKELSDIFSPLTRFFHIEKLDTLTREEVKIFVERELKNEGVKIEHACIDKIVEDSEGHPYMVNVMGHVLYNKLKDNEHLIKIKHYNENFRDIMNYLALDLFDGMYSKVTDAEKLILLEIAKEPGEVSTSQIAKKLKKKFSVIATPLQRLIEKNCIIKLKRGRYNIFHKLFRCYLLQNINIEA